MSRGLWGRVWLSMFLQPLHVEDVCEWVAVFTLSLSLGLWPPNLSFWLSSCLLGRGLFWAQSPGRGAMVEQTWVETVKKGKVAYHPGPLQMYPLVQLFLPITSSPPL